MDDRNNQKPNNDPNKKPRIPRNPWTYILVGFFVIIVMNLFSISSALRGHTEYVDYSKFLDLVEEGSVEKVEIGTDQISFTRSDNKASNLIPTAYYTYAVDDPDLVDRLHAAGVEFAGVNTNSMSFFDILISFVLPAVICPLLNALCRRLGWVKDGDLTIA